MLHCTFLWLKYETIRSRWVEAETLQQFSSDSICVIREQIQRLYGGILRNTPVVLSQLAHMHTAEVCLHPAVWFCLTALALLLLGLCDTSVKLWVLLVQRKYSSFLLSAAASCPEARALFYLTDYSLQMQTETWVCFSDPAAEWATAQRASRWYQKLMFERWKAHISVSALHESFTNQCLIPLCSFTICF